MRPCPRKQKQTTTQHTAFDTQGTQKFEPPTHHSSAVWHSPRNLSEVQFPSAYNTNIHEFLCHLNHWMNIDDQEINFESHTGLSTNAPSLINRNKIFPLKKSICDTQFRISIFLVLFYMWLVAWSKASARTEQGFSHRGHYDYEHWFKGQNTTNELI